MKLLIHVYAILETQSGRGVLEEVQDAVKEQLSDDGVSKSSDLANCIFGSEQPEIVKAEANTWNDSIRNDLLCAMEELKGGVSGGVFPLDTDHTFHLSLAARAADDNFTPCGKYGVLDDNGCSWPTFNVVLTPAQTQDIMENPENWMVADIMPL